MLFSEQAIELIYEHTKGIPRTINNLCMDYLLDAYGNENAVIDEVNVRRVLADKEMYQ
jgi:type II secretory pathway predicted ATPase ExeA